MNDIEHRVWYVCRVCIVVCRITTSLHLHLLLPLDEEKGGNDVDDGKMASSSSTKLEVGDERTEGL